MIISTPWTELKIHGNILQNLYLFLTQCSRDLRKMQFVKTSESSQRKKTKQKKTMNLYVSKLQLASIHELKHWLTTEPPECCQVGCLGYTTEITLARCNRHFKPRSIYEKLQTTPCFLGELNLTPCMWADQQMHFGDFLNIKAVGPQVCTNKNVLYAEVQALALKLPVQKAGTKKVNKIDAICRARSF